MNKLSMLLLATTCLTAISAAPAAAVPEVELNDTLATAQALPAGTTQVTGSLPFNGSGETPLDFFRLSDLQPGQNFVVTLNITSQNPLLDPGSTMSALTSTGTEIDVETVLNQGDQVTGVIPGNGILVLRLFGQTISVQESAPFIYALNIDAPRGPLAVPEPSVLSLLGAGATGLAAGAIRRLQRKRTER